MNQKIWRGIKTVDVSKQVEKHKKKCVSMEKTLESMADEAIRRKKIEEQLVKYVAIWCFSKYCDYFYCW